MTNKSLLLCLAMAFSGSVFAATDHYIRRDGTRVQHLKVTTGGDEARVSMDVDFEPGAAQDGSEACSAVISGEAKAEAANEWVMKKQITGEARYCTLTIRLSPTGAKVEQSPDCSFFAADRCSFDSSGKELPKAE